MDGIVLESMDDVVRGLNFEDVLNNAVELMNYEEYDGWCSSPCTSSAQMLPSVFAPLDGSNYAEQYVSRSPIGDSDIAGNWVLGGDKTMFPFCVDDTVDVIERKDKSSRKGSAMANVGNYVIPRPIKESLDEKIFRGLHLFKEWSGGCILAQVWVPMRNGDNYVLSTCEQPCLLDQMLSGYRQVSSLFTFATEVRPGSLPGLPGRVFMSRIPEWTSNVIYYSEMEYLRIKHAIDHRVRGSIALPVFEDNLTKRSCCAVIELVTVEEKQNFDLEMENVCRALQAVDLSSTVPPRLCSQSLSKNQKSALAEITDVLRVICHTHRLPLALTWIPCSYTEDARHETIRVHGSRKNISSRGRSILCVEETACYYSDANMQGFVHACGGHFLEEGQGIVGKALRSNQPLFYCDVKEYDISEYPLVHHARKFGLNAAVAIRLRSSYTGDDDYILEFFLPVNMKGSVEQQLLLNNLSSTMQKICKSLRKVSDEELIRENDLRVAGESVIIDNLNSVDRVSQNIYELKTTEMKDSGPSEQIMVGLNRPTEKTEKKRSTAEKHVSLSVLQQYFSGSLKDAAKSLGVCPTTLKRICRQHGISRWPSRKINKVNRSLKKIQRVLESVEGVEGGLKFDPTTGELVAAAAGSIIQDFELGKSFFFTGKNHSAKQSDSVIPTAVSAPSTSCITNTKSEGLYLLDVKPLVVERCDETRLAALDTGPSRPASLGTVPWETSLKATTICQSCVFPQRSSFINFSDEIDNGTKENTMINQNGVREHSQPTSSGMTDSSNGSGLMTNGSSSRSRSFGEKTPSKTEASCGDSGTKITVKATYRDDKIRFKFEPTVGCSELYVEVARRFKLQTDRFQLKYLDDEEEWVRLATDSDLLECLDILELLSTQTVKLLVRDLPSV